VLSLQDGSQDGKDRDDDHRIFKRYQSATDGCSYAVGGIVRADVPADIDTGAQQKEEYNFDGPSLPSIENC